MVISTICVHNVLTPGGGGLLSNHIINKHEMKLGTPA